MADARTLVNLALEDLGLSNLFRHLRDRNVSVDEIVKAVDEAYSVSLQPDNSTDGTKA